MTSRIESNEEFDLGPETLAEAEDAQEQERRHAKAIADLTQHYASMIDDKEVLTMDLLRQADGETLKEAEQIILEEGVDLAMAYLKNRVSTKTDKNREMAA